MCDYVCICVFALYCIALFAGVVAATGLVRINHVMYSHLYMYLHLVVYVNVYLYLYLFDYVNVYLYLYLFVYLHRIVLHYLQGWLQPQGSLV